MAFGSKRKQQRQAGRDPRQPYPDGRRDGGQYGDGDQYGDRRDDGYGDQDTRYGRYDDDYYDDGYDDRYDDDRDNEPDGRLDDRYDDEYGNEDDGYADGYDDQRPVSGSSGAAGERRDGDAGREARRPQDGDDRDGGESEEDWASRWSAWVPEGAFKDEDDEDDDLQPSDFGDEYHDDDPRRRQNLPMQNRTREMAETFVDRFRNGGTVGQKTTTNSIVAMHAISEADIPAIKMRLRRSNMKYNALMLVFAAIIAYEVWVIYDHLHAYTKNDTQMSTITAQYTKPIAQAPADVEMVRVNETDMPPIVDFAGLQSLNSEVSSWLRVPGTNIDYPVMTTPEEAKYLRLDIEGNYSIPGCLFTDWENDPDLPNERHIVIYGHHLPWPAMFHDMSRYLEEGGFVDGHRLMYYETPEQTYVLRVIGIHKAQPEEYDARRTIFNNQQEFQEYVDSRLGANVFWDSEDYDRKTINKLFTFITCTDNGSARCIVNAIVEDQYPTSYVPLVRAKMQGLIKSDGTIDSDKEAKMQEEIAAEEAAAQQTEEGEGGEG